MSAYVQTALARCWQEETGIDGLGAGMGISTLWLTDPAATRRYSFADPAYPATGSFDWREGEWRDGSSAAAFGEAEP